MRIEFRDALGGLFALFEELVRGALARPSSSFFDFVKLGFDVVEARIVVK
jgi:hypothetical protein